MDERRAYLQSMIAERGYVLDYHKVLVAEDLPFMKAINGLVEAAYTGGRRMDRKTKELVFSAVLTAIGSGKDHIKSHMEAARREGATKEEVLEILELLFMACGVPRFMAGLEVWTECFPVERIEPEPAGAP